MEKHNWAIFLTGSIICQGLHYWIGALFLGIVALIQTLTPTPISYE